MTARSFRFDARGPGRGYLDFSTARPTTVFPGYTGLHLETRRYDPLGGQAISNLCCSPHLLSHVDLPIPKSGHGSPILSELERGDVIGVRAVLVDASEVSRKAVDFVDTHAWRRPSKSFVSRIRQGPELGVIGPDIEFDDLAEAYLRLEVSVEDYLDDDVEVDGAIVVLSTNRIRYDRWQIDLSTTFLEGLRAPWFYPSMATKSVQELLDRGAIGVGTDAFSVDGFVQMLSGNSISEAVRVLKQEWQSPRSEGPLHDLLLGRGNLVLEGLSIPRAVFELEVSPIERVRRRVMAARESHDSEKEECKVVTGDLLLVPFFFGIPELRAVVVAVYFRKDEDTPHD